MNNKGQSLITFVLILPIITLFIAFFIDSSLSLLEKNKLSGVIMDNMKVSLKNDIRDIDKIKKAIEKNDNVNVDITINEDILHVKVNSKKKYLFGNILNLPWYNLEFNYCGNYLDQKINENCG